MSDLDIVALMFVAAHACGAVLYYFAEDELDRQRWERKTRQAVKL